MIESSFIKYKYLFEKKGLDILFLSIFNIDFVFPLEISMTINFPWLVVKKTSDLPIEKPTGLILFLLFNLNRSNTSVTLIILPVGLSIITKYPSNVTVKIKSLTIAGRT